jgi:hypothetical protein
MSSLLVRLSRPLNLNRTRLVVLACTLAFAHSRSKAAVFADQVAGYTPGTAPANFQTSQAALGPINGDTGFGGLNPFNPPFARDHIVIIGAGGSLSLRLSEPIRTAGGRLGVFVNNGLVDTSSNGSGRAGSPPTTFSPPPRAIVSVSSDGVAYVQLIAAPATFDNPTNAYLDTTIDNYFQPLGSQLADQGKPFFGRLSDFAEETYPQIRTRLAGSAGGTWLDLSTVPLEQVRYVRFDVPVGADYRMVVDSVSAVPEPTGAGMIALGVVFSALARRRGHRR